MSKQLQSDDTLRWQTVANDVYPGSDYMLTHWTPADFSFSSSSYNLSHECR